MVDLERTEKEYTDKGIPFPEDKQSELDRVKKFKHQVTTEAGNFNQDPDDKSIVYPKRVPTQLIRKKLLNEDGRVVLTTIETYYARDSIGNEVRLPMSEPQSYDTPIVKKRREYRDGRDVVVSEADGSKRVYTVDFTREAAEEAYNRAKKSMVTLLVQEDGLGRKEVVVKDFNKWVDGDFYDLLDNKPTTVTPKPPSTPVTKKVSGPNKVSTIEGEIAAE